MAAELFGTEYTVTGTATSLTTILGGGRKFLSNVVFRAGDANTGVVYIGPAGVTVAANRWGFLLPKESFGGSMHNQALMDSNQFYIIGSVPGDKLHIIGSQ